MTGNHWLSLPCIHPGDASIHAVGVLHRASRAAIEFAGSADFAFGTGEPLARPALAIDGVRHDLSNVPIAWERALGWIPTFTCTVAEIVVRGTIFAPYGRDADVSGAVYAISLENRRAADAHVDVSLAGVLGHRQLRVRTARAFEDASRVVLGASGAMVLQGASLPGLAALAVVADGDGDASVDGDALLDQRVRCTSRRASARRSRSTSPSGPERGRRRGDGGRAAPPRVARAAVVDARCAAESGAEHGQRGDRSPDQSQSAIRVFLCASAERSTTRSTISFARARHGMDMASPCAIGTRSCGRFPPCSSPTRRWRANCCCACANCTATRPAAAFTISTDRCSSRVSRSRAWPAIAIATDRYIRDTGDDRVVDEPALADTLYLAAEDLDTRRDKRMPLYSTEVSPSGTPVAFPFTLHANAAVAQALDVLRRTLDEETARGLQDPGRRSRGDQPAFPRRVECRTRDVSRRRSISPVRTSIVDDPAASAFWLPLYDAVARQDSTYRRTVKAIDVDAAVARAAMRAAHGSGRGGVLQWLRRAPLDGGVAAEVVDENGRAVGERRRRVAVRIARLVGVVRGQCVGRETVGGAAMKLHCRGGRWIYFAARGNSSVGRAQPCQGWGRGFESRFPLYVAPWRGATARPGFVLRAAPGWRNG